MIDENLSKVIRRVEIIAVIGIVAAAFLRVFQLPFSGFLIVIFLPSLAIAYFCGGLVLLKNKLSNTEKEILLMATGGALGISLIGITFKLMYWPNLLNMLLVSNVVLPVVICIAVWFKYNSAQSTAGDYNGFLFRVVLVYAVAAFLYITPNSTLIAFQYRGDNEMIRLKTQSYEHPENKEYRKQLEDYTRSQRGLSVSNDSLNKQF